MTSPSPPSPPARPPFETVYAVGLPFLHRALRWLGVETNDLDDMLQEIFLAAHRALPGYEPWRYHGAPSPGLPADGPPPLRITPEAAMQRWLFGIAWRKMSHYHARAHRRREIPSGAGASWPFDGRAPTPTPEQSLASDDRADIVTALLRKVAPERRVILVMYEMLGVAVADIARELDLKENTVRSRLRLAREDFRAAVARQSSERRSALRGLTASERPLHAAAASLLRAAAVFPTVPAADAGALWLRLQHRIALCESAADAPAVVPTSPRSGERKTSPRSGERKTSPRSGERKTPRNKYEAGDRTVSLTPPHVCVVSAPLAEKVLRSWPILRSGMSVCVTNGSPPRSRRSA
ncbi:RNA polymerase sigma factor [Sorangium sp. So ce861]|uniref:RNA polymerase sigma factor n=1 Tax=Sorangium sp. So ce861 TaxID=3133323 RepID=UPI003F609BD0